MVPVQAALSRGIPVLARGQSSNIAVNKCNSHSHSHSVAAGAQSLSLLVELQLRAKGMALAMAVVQTPCTGMVGCEQDYKESYTS